MTVQAPNPYYREAYSAPSQANSRDSIRGIQQRIDNPEAELESAHPSATMDSIYTRTLFSRGPIRSAQRISFAKTGSRISSAASRATVARTSTARTSVRSSSLRNGFKAAGFRQAGINMGITVGIYGGFSALRQGMEVMQGKQNTTGAVAVVLSDVLRSGMVGLGATAGGNFTSMALQSTRIAGGIWGTIATVVGGALGASIGNEVAFSTGLPDKLRASFGTDKIST